MDDKEMTGEIHSGYYVIRHKATGELMPQMKRGRGYSSWNPTSADKVYAITNVPRIIFGLRTAKRIVSLWNSIPNGNMSWAQNSDGGHQYLDIKPDGRKKEDLEIVPIQIAFGEAL